MRPVLALLALFLFAFAAACDDDAGDAPTSTPATQPAATATGAPSTPTPPASDAAITIDFPAEGAGVVVPFEASGMANVFEGALTIDLLDSAGATLCMRHVQATSGTGTPGGWSGILAFPPPAEDAPVTLRAYSFSAEDGSMQDLVERALTLSAEHPNIVIESPPCAEEIAPGPLAVSGMAQVFEAVLFVEVRDSSGTPLVMQRVMAASGTEYSPWSATLDLSGLQSGFYDLVAYTHSARDGAVIDEFPMQLVVR